MHMGKTKNIVIFCVLTVFLALFSIDGSAAGFGIFLLFFGLLSFITFSNIRRDSKFKAKNYAWYRKAYPAAYRDKRITCHSCDSDRVHTRNLMNQTFMREHFCSQCGQTLFYSPEGIQRP